MGRIFKGNIPNASTVYVNVPIRDGAIGLHIGWLDAISAATITLELSSWNASDAPIDEAGAANEWVDSGLTIPGPTGVAIAAGLVNVENVRQRRARLKIVTTADSSLEIYDGVVAR